VRTLARALAASTDDEEAGAARQLLDSLHDPATRIIQQTEPAAAAPSPEAPSRPDDAPIIASTRDFELPAGNVAKLRVAESVGGDPRADVVLPSAATETEVERAALKLSRASPRKLSLTSRRAPEGTVGWRPDATYADEPYPTREHRILALFRFWSVIHYFYPYLPLMNGSWDEDLAEMLPRFESAATENDYVDAVAKLAARIPDAHVMVSGTDAVARLVGGGRAPLATRVIEEQVVVTAVLDPAIRGIAVGDTIVAIDHEAIAARKARLGKIIAASNENRLAFLEARAVLTGPLGTSTLVTVRGADGETHDVAVSPTVLPKAPERSGAVYRLIADGIGYVDLDRLTIADVEPMVAALADTRAIVLDMRDYPHESMGPLAAHLNFRHAKVAAQFYEPLVTRGNVASSYDEQPLPDVGKAPYRGQTVMLIDERTMSQAEHTGLVIEAANGCKFVGSQTAGANGDLTSLSLPVGIYVSFSGHDVRHADGRPLQRIGLVPDVTVLPTIADIRAGRDEVLERAITYLTQGAVSASPRAATLPSLCPAAPCNASPPASR
jgi:C-terminal processing protease CtpA/Prc